MAKQIHSKKTQTSYTSRQQRRQEVSDNVLGREVLIVDNGPIRQRHFTEAQKVIHKIEGLEEKIRCFHGSDQKLYNQWFDLTFRSQRQEQENASTRYHELARFHNWVVATAHKLGLEMPQAYAIMRDEQIRWQNGTEEERRKIDIDRERREDYIRQEFRARYNEEFNFDTDEDEDAATANGGVEGLRQILDRLETLILDPDREEITSAEDRVERILALSNEQLIKAMDDQEAAFMMFDVSLNWGQTHDDYTLFKRLWRLMTGTQKTFFAYVYNSVTDSPIEEFLQSLGLSTDLTEGPNLDDINEKKFDFDEDEDDSDPILDDEYVDDPRRKQQEGKTARMTASTEERLKQTFRKLMRKLHPDVHAAESQDGKTPAWVQRVWALVQSAYNSKNVPSLERLLKLTLIRMNVLDELTVGEIAEARHWLKQDLEGLEHEARELKYHRAWGFSKKKNFVSLTQKIVREFQSELREIQDQIRELEEQHQLLEVLATRNSRSKQSSQSKTRLRDRGRRPRQRRTSRQQEFGFED